MSRQNTILILILAVLLFIGLAQGINLKKEFVVVEFAHGRINAGVAATPAAQTQGLSGRSGLAPDEGLLFIFKNPTSPGFWMKEMNFAIDIIWLDEQNRVIYLTNNFKPESYPQIIRPPQPITKVLEVSAGTIERLDLKIGDTASILP